MSIRQVCPRAEELERFARGELAPAERERVDEHLAHCGLCTLLVERLPEFDSEALSDPPAALPGWERVRGRLDRRFHAYLNTTRPKPRRLLGWLRAPALAYALALALLYPAYLGLRRATAPGAVALRPALLLNLDVARAEAAPPTLDRADAGGPVVLAFSLPARAGLRYQARLLDGAGRAVAGPAEVRGGVAPGQFHLACAPGTLAVGDYRLVVNAAGERDYVFAFTVR
jgi:hypothetical protein